MTRRRESLRSSGKYLSEGSLKSELEKTWRAQSILTLLFDKGIPSSELVGTVLDVPLSRKDTSVAVTAQYPDQDWREAPGHVTHAYDILRGTLRTPGADIESIRLIKPEYHPYRAQLEVALKAGLSVYVKVERSVPDLNLTFGKLRQQWQIPHGKLTSKLAAENLIILLCDEEETTDVLLRSKFFGFASEVVRINHSHRLR